MDSSQLFHVLFSNLKVGSYPEKNKKEKEKLETIQEQRAIQPPGTYLINKLLVPEGNLMSGKFSRQRIHLEPDMIDPYSGGSRL